MDAQLIVIDADQLDLILTWVLACTCSLAFCLGYLANEMGAK